MKKHLWEIIYGTAVSESASLLSRLEDGSSTMYFNGRVVNKPTTNGKSIKERSVSNIVCIG